MVDLPMSLVPLSWPAPPPEWRLGQTDVHVWSASLEVSPAARRSFAALLSAAERQRAARFHFEPHRQRFIVGRGWLRRLLGRYLETDPAALELTYSPQGKPSLGGAFAHAGLHFNLAHSENLALLAVTRLGSVGVDVETVRPLADAEELVERFFSQRESGLFRQLPEDQKPTAFFHLWTRKEAWLKATGEGIAHSLNLVEVSFLPGEPARLLHLPVPLAGTVPWTLQHLAPAPGFAGALAIAAQEARLQCWRWEELAGTLRDGEL